MTEEQLNIVFKQHHKGLTYFATSLVGEFYAEDIVVAAFLKLWNRGGHATPEGFLRTCIKNDCLNHIKHENKKRIHHEIIAYSLDEYTNATEVKSLTLQAIINAIEAMPIGQKKVTYLLKLGYSVDEMAEILKVTHSTIRVQVMRVRNKLKPLFSDN